MKKSTKMFFRILPVLMIVVFLVGGNVFGIPANLPATGTNSIGKVTGLANSIWNTISVVLQILAIAAIVLAGVRYMFASADTKADIKQQTIILVVGAILVFAAVPVAQFIASAANQAL